MTMRLVKNSTLQIVLTVACSLACLAPSSAFAQSTYTWTLNCSQDTVDGVVGTGADWIWLHDGVQILNTETPPNGFASCATPPLSGSGEIPASINGIQVNGIEVDLSVSGPLYCGAFTSVKKSFDPSNPKISINGSVSESGTIYLPGGGKMKCPQAGFHFTLNSD